MDKRLRQQSASARIEMLPGGVMLVRMHGPLTTATLSGVRGGVVQSVEAEHVRAFLADYTRATIAVSGEELDAVVTSAKPGSVVRLPAALLVRPDCVELFAGHALRVAALGVMRRVFCDPEEASCWARHRAQRVRRWA